MAWDGDKILIEKQTFTLVDLQSMVKGLYKLVRLQLLQELLLLDVNERGAVRDGTTQLPDLKLEDLRDNHAEMMEGWNFLKDPHNPFKEDDERWLFRQALAEEKLKKKFIREEWRDMEGGQGIPWKDQGVFDYMRAVQRFKERLFVLVHMTRGAPARGTEIVSIQYKNGVNGRGTRGVYIDRGLVSFVTLYHKGYSVSKKVKIIHWYVLREVSEMVIYYLWLVQPFIEIL